MTHGKVLHMFLIHVSQPQLFGHVWHHPWLLQNNTNMIDKLFFSPHVYLRTNKRPPPWVRQKHEHRPPSFCGRSLWPEEHPQLFKSSETMKKNRLCRKIQKNRLLNPRNPVILSSWMMKWCPIITETKGIAPLGSMKTMLSFGDWIGKKIILDSYRRDGTTQVSPEQNDELQNVAIWKMRWLDHVPTTGNQWYLISIYIYM